MKIRGNTVFPNTKKGREAAMEYAKTYYPKDGEVFTDKNTKRYLYVGGRKRFVMKEGSLVPPPSNIIQFDGGMWLPASMFEPATMKVKDDNNDVTEVVLNSILMRSK